MSIDIIEPMSSDIEPISSDIDINVSNLDLNLNNLPMYDECPICLENLIENIAETNCKHQFHFECLSDWIYSKKKIIFVCPTCNQNPCEIINVYSKKINITTNCNEITNQVNNERNNKRNNKRNNQSNHQSNHQSNNHKKKRNSYKIKDCAFCVIL